MDKNRTRTDLLAAGRKKLQQFRQKKDGKGSSKKFGKAGQPEADANASQSLASEGEVASRGDSEATVVASLSTSHSEENSAPDGDGSVGGLSSVPGLLESGEVEPLVGDTELMISSVEVVSTRAVGGDESAIAMPLSDLDAKNSEGETAHNTSEDPIGAEEVNVDSRSVGSEDKTLHLRDEIPDTSLVESRGDQEGESLDGRQSSRNSEVELDGNNEVLLPQLGTSIAEASSGTSLAEICAELPSEMEEVNEVSVSDGATLSNEISGTGSALDEAEIPSVSPAADLKHYEGKPEQSGQTETEDTAGGGSSDALENYGKSRDTEVENNSDGVRVASLGSDESSIGLSSQLLNLIRGLSEKEFDLVLESREPVLDNGLPHMLERLKEELFLTNFSKDISQMQLAQQSELQSEFDSDRRQLVDEIAVLSASLKESDEKNQYLNEDLVGCRFELQAAVAARDELEIRFRTSQVDVQELSTGANDLQVSLERSREELLSLTKELADCKTLVRSFEAENEISKGQISLMAEERNKLSEEKDFHLAAVEKLSTKLAALQSEHLNFTSDFSLLTAEKKMVEEEKENLRFENEKLSTEFANCKGVVSSLQLENAGLKESLDLVTEERKKLEDDKGYFARENERLLSEFIVYEEKISAENTKREKVEADLQEISMQLEQVIEENIFLSSSLEVHRAKLMKANDSGLERPLESGESEQRADVSESQSREVLTGFDSLRVHVEEAEKSLHQLERAHEAVRAYFSMSFSKTGGKLPSAGVSKLIQAFESKVQSDEQEAEESPSTENKSTADPFELTKVEIRNLKGLFKQLVIDATDACVLLEEECDGRRTVDVNLGELKDQYEALNDHCNSLEATNVELSVLAEVSKQHGASVEAKNNELATLCEATEQRVTDLKVINTELGSKLCGYESRIGELETQLYELQQISNESAAVIGDRIEDLHKEVSERVLMLEQDWNSTLVQVVEIIKKLGESARNFSSTVLVPAEGLDAVSCIAASVDATIKVIEDLQEKLETSQTEREGILTSFREVNQSCDDLQQKHDVAVGTLQSIHFHLKKLAHLHGSDEEREVNMEKLPDVLDYSSHYEAFIVQLEHLLNERLQLESAIGKLNSELRDRTTASKELERGCLHTDVVSRLLEDVEAVLELEDFEIHLEKSPALRFESLVSTLVHKYKETREYFSLFKEEFGSTVAKSDELQENIQRLIADCLRYETEISVLKGSLLRAEETLSSVSSELEKKTNELEQSEQRVSSVREKLGIAVSKGKGLIVQRDGLKQSLAETSSELERCLQELQLKDSRFHEVEAKLKTYSEAGERVEALESELSYIRNSATGLRESFLLKDSVLQRIEEILEDLDLPEHFHSRDILEKIEWLARSASGNALPYNDWDQKSNSAGGGSHTDAGFVTVEPWKENVQSNVNSGEDLKRKYEELESRFYGLAEQSEMLEQSLIERNCLIQKWEELLDGIDMPSQLRSLELEDKIQWLGRAVLEAHRDAMSLREKVVNFENYCGSLNADLEDSQRRISELEIVLETVKAEKENISERLEILSQDYDKILSKATEYEVENSRLESEMTNLEETVEKISAKKAEVESENKRLGNAEAEMVRNKEHILGIEGEIIRLQSLVSDVLQDSDIQDRVYSGSSIEDLELLLKKLLDNYVNFSSGQHVVSRAVDGLQTDMLLTDEAKSTNTPDATDSDLAILKKELDGALNELNHVKEERDRHVENQQSLVREIEALAKRREELELLLNQEEQRSASVREKLNVAVRKGKSVVQQRDGLKQTIDAMNADMENLKSEINIRESKLSEYEKKFGELSSYYPEKVEVLESEILSLRNHLSSTEQYFQETGNTLSVILNIIANVNVGDGVDANDPVKKLEQIVNLCRDMHTGLISSEEESRKSKRAAELLLAELNEVQERNDNLQEELANGAAELSELAKERDTAEAAKVEADSRLKELYNDHSLEQRNQFSELGALKSGIDQLRKGFSDVSNLLTDVCSKDLEFLHTLENSISTYLKPSGYTDVISIPSLNAPAGHRLGSSDSKGLFASIDSWLDSTVHGDFNGDSVSEVCSSLGRQLKELMAEVGALKGKLHNHSGSLHKQAISLSKSMEIAQRELMSRNESHEVMKRDIAQIELAGNEKENELALLRKNFSVLWEALSCSIGEIQHTKSEFLGKKLAAGTGMNKNLASFPGEGLSFSDPSYFPSDESIKTMADELLFAVRDFANIKAEVVEGSQKQMRTAINDLQKEIHEKEIQKERICTDLVGQIKVAEAAAARCLADLQSSSRRVDDLEKQLQVTERERDLMEQKVNELQDVHTTSTELQQKVKSLTDVIAAKDQEIEALMQALDEEELQMEEHVKKIVELEKVSQQKNLDLENAELSRGKAMKKLSVTVGKFDELHQLSSSLLAEVEKLQSQLQDRDAEVSFLRQEVTRSTNEALVASQLRNKRDSDGIDEFLTWFDMVIANVGIRIVHQDDVRNGVQAQEHKELLKEKIESVISELVDLREATKSKDTLLQVERSKVDDLKRKEEILQRSLRDKESRLNLLEGVGTSEMEPGRTSEIVEVEPLINKWTVPAPSVTTQVRSLRKSNNDQVAIAIDMDPESSNRLEDEDDDKVHGFKSLTTSRIVPRFTRPVTDMVDGLWVSCDRALMRQPALRLGIIIYWAVLHALIATLAI